MAQKIEEVNGIVADANYPKGYKIVDGSTDVNAKLYQDVVQFFQKLLKVANITANGYDDNEANGYQYLPALYATLRQYLVPSRAGFTINTGLTVFASEEEQKIGTNTLNYINSLLLKTQTGGYFRKTIEIGVWNMNSFSSKGVLHELSATEWKTIKVVNVMIVHDTIDALINIYYADSGGNSQGSFQSIDSTEINLDRVTGGYFDSTSFESTSINRGFITFDYIPD